MLESDEEYAARDYANRKLYNELFPSKDNNKRLNASEHDELMNNQSNIIDSIRKKYETNYKYWDKDRR